MSKLKDAVAALKDFHLETDEDAHEGQVRAVLKSIRDPKDIPPSQLGAWQRIIDSILEDGK